MALHQQASTGQFVDNGQPAPVTEDVKVKEVNGKPVMHIKVHSPLKDYYDDDAYSISAVNDTGPFDILPRHHNFMTLLNSCDIVINGVNGLLKIRINRGVMHVKADQVTVFLDV